MAVGHNLMNSSLKMSKNSYTVNTQEELPSGVVSKRKAHE